VDIHKPATKQIIVAIDVVQPASRSRVDDSQPIQPRLEYQSRVLVKTNSYDELGRRDVEEV